jgi:hypothetical protein
LQHSSAARLQRVQAVAPFGSDRISTNNAPLDVEERAR